MVAPRSSLGHASRQSSAKHGVTQARLNRWRQQEGRQCLPCPGSDLCAPPVSQLERPVENLKSNPMPIASYRQFCIEVADGWSARAERDSTSDFLSITPNNHTAELRLTTFDPQQMSARDWVDFAAHTNRMKNRPVSGTEVGPLAGYEVQFVGGATWVRGWVLESNGIPLDITYRSDVTLRGLDDADIDAMLETLQMDPITEQDAPSNGR